MSFVAKYDLEYRDLLEKRADGFRVIFEILEKRNLKRYSILETGMLRVIDNWVGDGQSTRLFDAFVNFYDGVVVSVDIDPKAISNTRPIVSLKTQCVCADSVRFLNELSIWGNGVCNFDLLYLDSYDVDWENPIPSSLHHIKELLAIGKLKSETIICVDDNKFFEGKDVGKGKMVGDYFSDIGVPLIHDAYQKIWQIP